MTVLFIGKPTPNIASLLNKSTSYYINYDLDFYSIQHDKHTLLVSWTEFSNNTCIYDSIILSELPYFIDLCSRWHIAEPVKEESILSISSMVINYINILLEQFPVKACFACYATPHHIWNNLIELALRLNGLAASHLYPFLETEIASPIVGTNHHIKRYVFNSNAPSFWRDYVSSTIDCYLSRVKRLQFSPASYSCFRYRYANTYYADLRMLIRTTRKHFSNILSGNQQYHPLKYLFYYKPTLLQECRNLLEVINQQKLAIDYYNCHIADLSNVCLETKSPNFLICAHFQPEASTAPLGGEYFNHLNIVEDLRIQYPDCLILYKEHPGSFYYNLPGGEMTMVGIARSIHYYKFLKELGVIFVNPHVNALRLLSVYKQLIPVSITGSICLEAALFVSSPGLYYGEPYWKGYPGAVSCKTHNISEAVDQRQFLMSEPSNLFHICKTWLLNTAITSGLPNVPGFGISSSPLLVDPDMLAFFAKRMQSLLKA